MQSNKWKGLTAESAKRFYDQFGSKQDKQAFYEDNALNRLIEHGRFDAAKSVYEFGCGTGRFAEKLFRDHFHAGVWYTGCDISSTMLKLSKKRLEPFSARVTLTSSFDKPLASYPDNSFDRFISNYVFDLLSEDDLMKTLLEARRILNGSGFLCVTSIARGKNFFTSLVSSGWNILFHLNPAWVGGCRPIRVLSQLDLSMWYVCYHQVDSQFGISSEILIASPRK